MKLEGKSAIVTGAASGIGKEIAFTYAREGAKVAIADLNLDAANGAAAQIRDAGGEALGVAREVPGLRGRCVEREGVAAAMPSASQPVAGRTTLLAGRSPDSRVEETSGSRRLPVRSHSGRCRDRTRLPLRGQCRNGRARTRGVTGFPFQPVGGCRRVT